jgi:hypothetical protein
MEIDFFHTIESGDLNLKSGYYGKSYAKFSQSHEKLLRYTAPLTIWKLGDTYTYICPKLYLRLDINVLIGGAPEFLRGPHGNVLEISSKHM